MAKIKIDDYMRGRNEGMQFALRIAKEKGIEGLEYECKFRQATNLPTAIQVETARKAFDEIRINIAQLMRILAVATLRDEFGFGYVRLNRFIERFDLKVECITEDYVEWNDLVSAVYEETRGKINMADNLKDELKAMDKVKE